MSILGLLIRTLQSLFCGSGEKPEKPQGPLQQPYQPPPQVQQPQPHYPPQQHPQPHHPPQQPPHKPTYSQPEHKPTKPQSGSHRPPGSHSDPNQANQHNPYYTNLRTQANSEGDAMARCFSESKEAYSRGNGALAKDLSDRGKEHKQEMERLNKEASDWIFRGRGTYSVSLTRYLYLKENNTDSGPNEVDLHGLYVKEAIARTEQAVMQARARGDQTIHLIVGKGMHSKGGVAKLKPAIEELMAKYQLAAHLDSHNEGVLIVSLGGHMPDQGRRVDPGEISRRLENESESCVIM